MRRSAHYKRALPLLAIAVIMLPLIASAAEDIVTPIANHILSTVRVLVLIVFVAAVVAFGWGIVQFVYADGNPTAIAKAKNFLLWGVIGMAVMASLFGLVTFLQTYFGVDAGVLDVQAPTVNY